MSRENIVSEFVSTLKSMNTIKLGVVQRDPIIVSELPKTAFPAVYVETVSEDRENLTMGATRTRRSMMEIDCVIVVGGKERDKQRNLVVDAIESQLALELVQIGESEPYASCRMIFSIEYHYDI